MEWLESQDPIIACSTGTFENTAISILRISSPSSLGFLSELFNLSLEEIEPRKSYLRSLTFDGKLIDEVVLTFYKGPHSYNGENILELGVHGNQVNVRRILEIFENFKVRLANPGEITYRGLRNNKFTMSQVEGLDTLLNASSVDIFDQGMDGLTGSLQKEYLILKDLYLNLRGSIEILIDFSDDVGEDESFSNLTSSFTHFKNFLQKLKSRIIVPRTHLLKPKVVLLGNTNAGKSTLFNNLVQEDRAIVSHIEGTTRDYISEYFYFKGIEFQVVDTAGIRDSADEIETKGIALSKKLFSEAFFKLLVINPFRDEPLDTKDLEIDGVIFTHADESGFLEKLSNYKQIEEDFKCFWTGSIGPVCYSGPIGPELVVGPIGPREESGPIEPLIDLKNEVVLKYKQLIDSKPILAQRQRSKISEAFYLTEEISQVIRETRDLAIISSEINNLGCLIDELLGVTTADEVLNNIFSNFCIGK